MTSEDIHVSHSEKFELPALDLLACASADSAGISEAQLALAGKKIEEYFRSQEINAEVLSTAVGPVITQFRVRAATGANLNRFVAIAKELSAAVGEPNIRVVENLGGPGCIGLEVPNPAQARQNIRLKELLSGQVFQENDQQLPMAVGKSVLGATEVIGLVKAPHLLLAGLPQSGVKSAVQAAVLSLLFKYTPQVLKLLLISPNAAQLSCFDGIAHLAAPVITESDKALHALDWATRELECRHEVMKNADALTFEKYNQSVREGVNPGSELPFLVVVIDDFADLFADSRSQAEPLILRLLQKGRTAGIHLILATEQPSAEVVSPVIKAGCPTRLCFKVSSAADSQTVISAPGAEELLEADMLLVRPGSTLKRLHCVAVEDEEAARVAESLRMQGAPAYEAGVTEAPAQAPVAPAEAPLSVEKINELYKSAMALRDEAGELSAEFISSRLGCSENVASALIDMMAKNGLSVSSETGKSLSAVSEAQDLSEAQESAARNEVSLPESLEISRDDFDELYKRAAELVMTENNPSSEFLKTTLGCTDEVAEAILDQMQANGLISAPSESGERVVCQTPLSADPEMRHEPAQRGFFSSFFGGFRRIFGAA